MDERRIDGTSGASSDVRRVEVFPSRIFGGVGCGTEGSNFSAVGATVGVEVAEDSLGVDCEELRIGTVCFSIGAGATS